MNALVEATPISGPASVGRTAWDFARDGGIGYVDDGRNALSVGLCKAQRRQGIGRLAGLRHKHGKSAGRQGRLPVAQFGGDVDLNGNARVTFDPMLADEAGIVGGAARRDCHVLDCSKVNAKIRQGHGARSHVKVDGERTSDHIGLLLNFLRHEVAMVALVNDEVSCCQFDDGTNNLAIGAIEYRRADARDDGPVTVLEVGDGIR